MRKVLPLTLLLVIFATTSIADTLLFEDPFQGKLKEGWSWLREDPAGWRVTDNGLEIKIEPGNMWGGANDAKNILMRPVSIPKTGLSVQCSIENSPSSQYEQVDLVWYYDDAHMVKIGLELVHGQLSLVMGREEKDRAKTLSIIPLKSGKLDLRLDVHGKNIRGQWRYTGTGKWQEGGKCDLPVKGAPKITLQCYQGNPNDVHWARIHSFKMVELD